MRLVVEFTVLGVPCMGINGGPDTPKALTEAMAKGGEAAKRAFAAMMTMKKIDVAAIEAAVYADA